MANTDQIITGYDLWYLRLPVVSARDHGIGRVDGNCEIVVLRLTSEGGVEGFGEASPWSVFTGSPEASYAALDRDIGPVARQRLQPHQIERGHSKPGLELHAPHPVGVQASQQFGVLLPFGIGARDRVRDAAWALAAGPRHPRTSRVRAV